MTSSPHFKVHKKILANKLTVLVRQEYRIPRVETHLWYNVGSKDENVNERGMAHLIEHMIFKGTKNLSESDINLICQKLVGEANAFTSQDYTCYTFRFPTNTWQTALELLAECMQHATFPTQMLSSELKAVIEELHLYNENYQGSLVERVTAAAFPDHPYRNPIIGTVTDLCSLTRDNLYAFYRTHYHPANAVLVITGNVDPETAFEAVEHWFGKIPSPHNYVRAMHNHQEDLVATTTTLSRPTQNPWLCFAYHVPGLSKRQNHLIDIANFVIGFGKSSRLYQRLVNKERLAIDVDCSTSDFFEHGLFFINVWPAAKASAHAIEETIHEELATLARNPIHAWEFAAAKKRTHIDFTSLLEHSERQALVIGNSYLATGDENFVDSYLAAINRATKTELQIFFDTHFKTSQQHKGCLLPAAPEDTKRLVSFYQATARMEQKFLQSHQRTIPVEGPRWAKKISKSPTGRFEFPHPKTFTLSNGLEVLYHHTTNVPQVTCLLSLKTNYLYEPEHHAGILGFLLRVISDRTKKLNPDAFAKLLEQEGIALTAGGDNVAFRCLSEDFEMALSIVAQILQHPVFDTQSIEKVRRQIISEIEEFWDSPIDFIDQVALELIYQEHPYHKNPMGTKQSIASITLNDLKAWYKNSVSPHQAVLVIVGDLHKLSLQSLVNTTLGAWQGPEIADLSHPELPPYQPITMTIPIDREQVVVGCVAPSVSRKDPTFNALSLLDIIVTGGPQASPSSRLFNLRERSGLFYTIGGSLIYGSREQQGMTFIKTIVAPEKLELAQHEIATALKTVQKEGISTEELSMAKNLLLSSSVELFETNASMAQTFLFLKKLNLPLNLFDKQGEILSIIGVDQLNEIAQRFCNPQLMSKIHIGRIEKYGVAYKKGESLTKEARKMAKKSKKTAKKSKKASKKKVVKKAKKAKKAKAKKVAKKKTTRRMKMRVIGKMLKKW
jgi:zinc protease